MKFPHRLRGMLLLATLLLFAQTAAMAHELEHTLHLHNDPSCPLHVYADHLGKTSGPNLVSLPLIIARDASPTTTNHLPSGEPRAAVFRSRAPPSSPLN